MNEKFLGFLVSECELSADNVVVRGRYTEGALNKGCVFTHTYPIIVEKEGHTINLKKGKISNVNLEIQEVRMYGKKLIS